ncbi:MAG: site-2 protease family protein, partial [Rhodospirillales bacterium]|nr:site-2 protease family protein [Rhodospirillales bacterium]
MDVLALIGNLGSIWESVFSFGGNAVQFIVAITVLVFVHELGHYLVARWNGVRVEVFSIGFGMELKGWADQHGTRWKICAIPLGGYVKMFGESETVQVETDDGEEPEERPMTDDEKAVSFHHKTLMQRAAIVFAGPLVNFLFAIVVFTALFSIVGVPKADPNAPIPAIVGAVATGGAAHRAGLERSDVILRLGADKINDFSELQRVVERSPGKTLEATIRRGDKEIQISVTPDPKEVKTKSGQTVIRGLLGISAQGGPVTYVQSNPIAALWLGVEQTYAMSAKILVYLGDVIAGQKSANDLGGIIRIAQISGQMAEQGVVDFVFFMAM